MDTKQLKATEHADELTEMRAQVELLTRAFIDNLIESNQSDHNQMAFLSTILDSVADGLIVFDTEGRILLANPGVVAFGGPNITRMTRREFLDQYQFMPDGQTLLPKEDEPYAVAIRTRRPHQVEGLIKGPNCPAAGMWIRSLASPILDVNKNVLGVVTIFQDISKQRRLHHEHEALGTLLTHDIKNHLASESLLLDMIVSTCADKLDADNLKLVGRLKDASQDYMRLSNTLLQLQRLQIDAAGAGVQTMDVRAVIESVIRMDRNSQVNDNVELIMNCPDNLPPLNGISSALHQIIHNLVQNAMNATASGGKVEVRATSGPNSITITVKDNGNGMTQRETESLFDVGRVSQFKETANHSTGFGLYLSSLLVHAHGGKITCQSEPGVGTTMSIELPLSS